MIGRRRPGMLEVLVFSQTTEYALRAMLHIAALPAGESASSEVISGATKVPARYISKVLRDLVLARLITSQRGPNGGFSLARPPSAVTLFDVVEAVDPFKRITECPLGDPAHIKLCPLHRRLDAAMDLIERQFRETTLAEVIEETKPACGAFMQPRLPEGKTKRA